MEQEYEVKTMRPFQKPDLFESDLEFAARRAKMLAWALDNLAVSQFDVKGDNEWLWDLSAVFLDIVGRDLEAASDLAQKMRVDARHDQKTPRQPFSRRAPQEAI